MTHDSKPDPSLVDRVAVGIIRSGNAAVIEPSWTDEDCLRAYGDEARPFAEALVGVVRDVADELLRNEIVAAAAHLGSHQ